ncbi:MAG: zinc-dependent metalloprotease family protein [Wenzhouxiangella sp.]
MARLARLLACALLVAFGLPAALAVEIAADHPEPLDCQVIPPFAHPASTAVQAAAQTIQGGGRTIEITKFELADVAAPMVDLPVSYVFDARVLFDNGCCEFSGGTRLLVDLPPHTTFIEAASARGRQFPCEVAGNRVECVFPDEPTVQPPVFFGLMHHEPGPVSVSMELVPAPGDTLIGASMHQVDTSVMFDDGEPAVIDVLFLHSQSMPDRYPGSRLESKFDTWIAYSNRILRESGVHILFRNAGVHEFVTDESLTIGQLGQQGIHIWNTDRFNTLREATGADLAVYFRPRVQNDFCGNAPLALPGQLIDNPGMSLFIVQDDMRRCTTPNGTVFLHEAGHALGLGHYVNDSFSPRGYWEFSRGHREEIGVDNGGHPVYMGTIMSANNSNRMANPDVDCPQGVPCGRDIWDIDPAHAALSLNALRHAAAAAMPALAAPDQRDLGVFLRGLSSDSERVEVRVEIQNYSRVDATGSPLELRVPAGWALVGSEPEGSCTQSGAHIHCDAGPLDAYQSTYVDIAIFPGGEFEPLVARLTNTDAFARNNQSVYDPRAHFPVQSRINDVEVDPAVQILLENRVKRDLHVPYALESIDISKSWDQPPQQGGTILSFTGDWNFGLGRPDFDLVFCSMLADGIKCPFVPHGASYDPDYEFPELRTGAIVDLSFAPSAAVEPADISVELDIPFVPASMSFPSRIAGNYFDPQRSGEGCQLTLEADGNTFILTCYTYLSGRQVWMIGTGTLQGGEIAVADMHITRGADFGPAFDPDDVERIIWGTVTLQFLDCNHATLNFQSQLPEFEQISLSTTKLVPGNCLRPKADPFLASLAGNYFDPQRSGEGFQLALEADGETFILTYYTYLAGEQVWLIGTGRLVDGSIVSNDMHLTEGAEFGLAFDPDDVVRIPWGTITLEPIDCNSTLVRIEPELPGFQAMDLQVTKIVTGPC